MAFPKIFALIAAISFASEVRAHGTVHTIVADGVPYSGYNLDFRYTKAPAVVVGWDIRDDGDTGFVAPVNYTSSDIVCHINAKNAQQSATVSAGGKVEMQWTVWPSSHHGPVIDYLAKCPGDCATVDKNTLEFFKIDQMGLTDGSFSPGAWGADKLIADGNKWTTTIPTDIAPGNYVLRHEIIALHSAYTKGLAQNYPQCFNLKITGSGTATPAGVLATKLYTMTDPGIFLTIWTKLASYAVPGPALYVAGKAAVQATPPASAVSAPATASAPAASAPAAALPDASPPVVSAPPAPVLDHTKSASAPHMKPSPFSNSTMSACKNKKSECTAMPKKSHPAGTSPSVPAGAAPSVPTLTATPNANADDTATAGVSDGSTTLTKASTPPTTTTLPTGTTLSSVIAWLSNFYTKHTSGAYTGDSTLERRHARSF